MKYTGTCSLMRGEFPPHPSWGHKKSPKSFDLELFLKVNDLEGLLTVFLHTADILVQLMECIETDEPLVVVELQHLPTQL